MSQLVERLDDLSREFELDQRQVASVLGANPRTVSRWLRSETSPSRDARERLLEFLAVLERLSVVLQPSAANDWLFTPNGALGNEKPALLLREGRYREVLAAVDALAEGVFQQLPSPELVQRVDRLRRTSIALPLHRLMSGRYPPASGEGARTLGGRWNPRDSFPTLYLASTLDTAVAEVRRAFAAQGRAIEEAVGLVVYEFEVELSAVLDLRDEADLGDVGLSVEDLGSLDRSPCQAVGDAAHFIGLEAIWAPSASGHGKVVAIFTDKQRPDSVIAPGTPTPWVNTS